MIILCIYFVCPIYFNSPFKSDFPRVSVNVMPKIIKPKPINKVVVICPPISLYREDTH